jgi:DNA-directed RNA polymerase subunit RPC12/RpoP
VKIRTAFGIIGAVAAAVLLFFSVVYALASSVQRTSERMNVAILLFTIALAIIIALGIVFYLTREPKTVIQRLEVSGEMKAVSLKCPSCAGPVDAKSIKIVSGVPYATCPYCGHTFEVAEEPKW